MDIFLWKYENRRMLWIFSWNMKNLLVFLPPYQKSGEVWRFHSHHATFNGSQSHFDAVVVRRLHVCSSDSSDGYGF